VSAISKWIVSDSQCVPGLGRGELLQSEFTPTRFLARLVLNSYESNCLRDWLAQRWKSPSLRQTCVAYSECKSLSISLSFQAKDHSGSKTVFDAWLKHVLEDRVHLEQLRK
jgi:hypothetical protein